MSREHKLGISPYNTLYVTDPEKRRKIFDNISVEEFTMYTNVKELVEIRYKQNNPNSVYLPHKNASLFYAYYFLVKKNDPNVHPMLQELHIYKKWEKQLLAETGKVHPDMTIRGITNSNKNESKKPTDTVLDNGYKNREKIATKRSDKLPTKNLRKPYMRIRDKCINEWSFSDFTTNTNVKDVVLSREPNVNLTKSQLHCRLWKCYVYIKSKFFSSRKSFLTQLIFKSNETDDADNTYLLRRKIIEHDEESDREFINVVRQDERVHSESYRTNNQVVSNNLSSLIAVEDTESTDRQCNLYRFQPNSPVYNVSFELRSSASSEDPTIDTTKRQDPPARSSEFRIATNTITRLEISINSSDRESSNGTMRLESCASKFDLTDVINQEYTAINDTDTRIKDIASAEIILISSEEKMLSEKVELSFNGQMVEESFDPHTNSNIITNSILISQRNALSNDDKYYSNTEVSLSDAGYDGWASDNFNQLTKKKIDNYKGSESNSVNNKECITTICSRKETENLESACQSFGVTSPIVSITSNCLNENHTTNTFSKEHNRGDDSAQCSNDVLCNSIIQVTEKECDKLPNLQLITVDNTEENTTDIYSNLCDKNVSSTPSFATNTDELGDKYDHLTMTPLDNYQDTEQSESIINHSDDEVEFIDKSIEVITVCTSDEEESVSTGRHLLTKCKTEKVDVPLKTCKTFNKKELSKCGLSKQVTENEFNNYQDMLNMDESFMIDSKSQMLQNAVRNNVISVLNMSTGITAQSISAEGSHPNDEPRNYHISYYPLLYLDIRSVSFQNINYKRDLLLCQIGIKSKLNITINSRRQIPYQRDINIRDSKSVKNLLRLDHYQFQSLFYLLNFIQKYNYHTVSSINEEGVNIIWRVLNLFFKSTDNAATDAILEVNITNFQDNNAIVLMNKSVMPKLEYDICITIDTVIKKEIKKFKQVRLGNYRLRANTYCVK